MGWNDRDVEVQEAVSSIVITRHQPKRGGLLIVRIFGLFWVLTFCQMVWHTAKPILFGLPYGPVANARTDAATWGEFLITTSVGLVSLVPMYLLSFAGPETITFTADEMVTTAKWGELIRTWRCARSKARNFRLVERRSKTTTYVIKVDHPGGTRTLFLSSDKESTERLLQAIHSTLARRGWSA